MRAIVLPAFLLSSADAMAHTGHVHWTEIETRWTWDPLIVAPLIVSLGLYATGVTRLWRRAGVGRGVQVWQAACFSLAWLMLVSALVAPLHWFGERLFTAHMIEHEILMTVAAPLIVIARPFGAALWGLPTNMRQVCGAFRRNGIVSHTWRTLTQPLVATILHGVAIWMWHAPGLYGAALQSPRLHWLEHVSFLATALLFWWALLGRPDHERFYGTAVFYLFVTTLHTGFLGILLSVARQPLYPLQTRDAFEWGLTPLEDQQLAGLIMWVPGGMAYAVAALAVAGMWIARSGRRQAITPITRTS